MDALRETAMDLEHAEGISEEHMQGAMHNEYGLVPEDLLLPAVCFAQGWASTEGNIQSHSRSKDWVR